MVNVKKLRGKMVELDINVDRLATEIEVNTATLYRKIDSGNFTVKEAQRIADVLGLNKDELNAIFFSEEVA